MVCVQQISARICYSGGMRILFLGGTGIISSAAGRRLAERPDVELTFFLRGRSSREIPPGVEVVTGDLRDRNAVSAQLGSRRFDVVVNFIAFTPAHVEADIELFRGKIGQYVFISSASAYQTPPARLPVTESTPLKNPFWAYSRDKIACEDVLTRAYRELDFPATIVRPSHTYDRRTLPVHGGYTVIERMRRGKPVVVHGDGTSLWTLTHHADFARGFVGLLGHPYSLGEAFHITGDEWLSWNEIFRLTAQAAGVEPKVVHVPSDLIAKEDPAWGAGLLGDKAYSMMFDNSKIRRLVPDFNCPIPFAQGVREVVAWHLADTKRQVVDAAFTERYERILTRMKKAWN